MNSSRLTIPEVLPLFQAFYEDNPAGFFDPFHVILEDGNVQNFSVQYARRTAIASEDTLVASLADLLLALSQTQRLRLGGLLQARPLNREICYAHPPPTLCLLGLQWLQEQNTRRVPLCLCRTPQPLDWKGWGPI